MNRQTITLTNRQARQFLLAKQGLLGDWRFAGKAGALEYVRQAGCIQFDPVDICGKNAELTLQSRVKGFRRAMLQELLYEDRALVDYPDKELAIFSTEDWPYFRRSREVSRVHGLQFADMEELAEAALTYIGEHGPVSADTLPLEGEIVWHSGVHWSGNWHGTSRAARSVLEQLYTEGRLVIHHKSGTRKWYDAASRHIPKEILGAEEPFPDEEDYLCWRVLRRIGAAGLLWDRSSPAFLGIPMTTEQRREAFRRLAENGRIAPVTVEGLRNDLYVRADDLPLLDRVLDGTADLRARCEFLAPLDPFLWDKELILRLFGFRYSWEIYTPADRRKYGPYVLPIVYGEGFAGRIEAAADTKKGVLTVKHIWYEEGVRRTKKLDDAIRSAAGRLGRMSGCREIRYE